MTTTSVQVDEMTARLALCVLRELHNPTGKLQSLNGMLPLKRRLRVQRCGNELSPCGCELARAVRELERLGL